MPRDKGLMKRRDQMIMERYDEEYEQGLRMQKILDKLSMEFHLTPNTIYDIISGKHKDRLAYEDPNQTKLFDDQNKKP